MSITMASEIFQASHWTRGNFLFPTRIEVNERSVVRRKRSWFNVDEISISVHKTLAVRIKMAWLNLKTTPQEWDRIPNPVQNTKSGVGLSSRLRRLPAGGNPQPAPSIISHQMLWRQPEDCFQIVTEVHPPRRSALDPGSIPVDGQAAQRLVRS